MATRFQNQTLKFFLTTAQGKTYTVTFFTGFLLLVMIFVALLPATSAIVAQLAENQLRRDALEEINQKLTGLRALSANEQSNRAVSVALADVLPNGFDQATVLEEFLALAREADVLLTTYRTADAGVASPEIVKGLGALGPRIGANTITLVLDGGRGQLETLVNLLESSYRVYNIKAVSMSLITQGSEIFEAGSAFRMTITCDVYYWKLPTEI